ncbi:NlpC/P60 family protein [[Clostridium] nexile DSM 1787]|nr:NlpC/P60 family protein [[Clostridium] nexile DSM 1787]
MYSKFLKKGIALGVLTSAVLIPNDKVLAAEAKNAEGVSTVNINKGYLANATAEIERYVETELKNVYEDMAFTQVEEGSYLFVRTEPSQDSEWVGKLYEADAAKVVGPVGEWTQIESGNVTGYVKTEYILTGESAEEKAKAIVAEKKPEVDVETLDEAKAEELAAECFSYAESKEEEAARLAEEAAKAEEEAKAAEAETVGNGQAVVDYAMQFVGNPYVWGGTSLTNGADCSGFVQSVYANFGVSMPRTSSAMRSAGTEVSYSEAVPGDVICYEGHVGIYIGNGQIVNAIDEAHGIGVSSATYTNIITVRRLL